MYESAAMCNETYPLRQPTANLSPSSWNSTEYTPRLLLLFPKPSIVPSELQVSVLYADIDDARPLAATRVPPSDEKSIS